MLEFSFSSSSKLNGFETLKENICLYLTTFLTSANRMKICIYTRLTNEENSIGLSFLRLDLYIQQRFQVDRLQKLLLSSHLGEGAHM